jgi:drug/metabolite transporter (DMT)-like permease
MTATSGVIEARPALGTAAMLLNTLLIPLMAVGIKTLTDLGLATLEMLAIRSWITLAMLLPLLLFASNIRALMRADLKAHLVHSAFAITTMACFYYALRTMPIVTVTAINFTTPMFTLMLARILFGERVALRGWLALLLGFAGTVLVLRPDASGIGLDAAVVLFGSLMAAGMNLAVRRMPARSTNYAVLFYFSLAGAIVYGAVGAPVISWPQPDEIGWLVGLAAIALAVHTCTTVAYRLAASLVVGALDYLRIVWAAVIGYLVFAEMPDALDGLGALMIVASGLIVLQLSFAARREAV